MIVSALPQMQCRDVLWPALAMVGLWLLVIPAVALAQLPALPSEPEKVPTVVLDPGHGGADLGARGPTGLLEKDITLQLATEAGRLIEELLGMRVVFTRRDDAEVSLEARASLANQAEANLFISIHAGGALAPSQREFQVFYFDNIQAVATFGGVAPTAPDLTEQPSLLPRQTTAATQPVLWEQAQMEFLATSQMAARILYNNLRTQVGEDGRGVFGLPLLLLRWVHLPAVMLDVGSIDDPGFEAKLRDQAYLQRAALGIAQAINDYQALQR